jgi:hypothetical protein
MGTTKRLCLVLGGGGAIVVGALAACSDTTASTANDAGPADVALEAESGPLGANAGVKITAPEAGASFVITADLTDIDVAVSVTGFTLVPLGTEASDPNAGQVRLFVDGTDCNDPGTDAGPLPYNRILPNGDNESTIGMDYCVGGIDAVNDKSHTLQAQLWHGGTRITTPTATDTISFHTYFSDGGADATADAVIDSPPDAAEAE